MDIYVCMIIVIQILISFSGKNKTNEMHIETRTEIAFNLQNKLVKFK